MGQVRLGVTNRSAQWGWAQNGQLWGFASAFNPICSLIASLKLQSTDLPDSLASSGQILISTINICSWRAAWILMWGQLSPVLNDWSQLSSFFHTSVTCSSAISVAPSFLSVAFLAGLGPTYLSTKQPEGPWLGSSAGRSINLTHQRCRFHPRSGHVQEATSECINR